ncbi:TetR/AcrR family transcriptional regulator [Sciscionella marina]|uniref:TetR/AcrR family transcriptional regulator n=1 Tax=Sciscionella marina TaxID=508770 RepID=UPI00035EBEE7|nr:TetR family transcriptional regulator [Sciscionella marina]
MATTRGVRRVRQDRSRQRRDALLEAAVELIEESGLRAVTHRAVSVRAGFSPATAGNYFPSTQDLIEHALRHHVGQRAERLAETLREAVAGAENLTEIGDRIARALVEGRTGVTAAQYEVYLEASRNPALRSAVGEAMSAFEEAAVPLLTALEVADPRRAARSFVAIADGFAVHRLANPMPADEEISLINEALAGVLVASVLPIERIRDILPEWQGRR